MRVITKISNWLNLCVVSDVEDSIGRFLGKSSFVCVLLMTAAAPHSIFVTQLFWILGILLFVSKAAHGYLTRKSLDIQLPVPAIAMISLFLWTLLTAIFSYAPDISLRKLNTASLILIFLLVVNVVRNRYAVKVLVFTLIGSAMINVIWMPVERVIGRGVEVNGINAESPLKSLDVAEGDTFLEVNGVSVGSPQALIDEIEKTEVSRIKYYRPDYYEYLELKRADLLTGETPTQQLGVKTAKRSMNWRSAGFYGHYATYAEVLQLLGSLVFGLLVGMLITNSRGREVRLKDLPKSLASGRFWLFFLVLALMGLALLLTSTRASQAALLVSCVFIGAFGLGKRAAIAIFLISIPLVIGGAVFLQQSRNTTFVDQSDNSTTWRQTVYKEGLELWTDSPRHFVVGVGMDSIKRYAVEWKLFDNGRLPAGHFHSNPIQLVVERGLPALLIYLWLFVGFLWNLVFAIRGRGFESWWELGLLLGTFGGVIGFQLSGLVHYNFGDSEVVMVLFILMALSSVLITEREVEGGKDADAA